MDPYDLDMRELFTLLDEEGGASGAHAAGGGTRGDSNGAAPRSASGIHATTVRAADVRTVCVRPRMLCRTHSVG